MSCSSEKELEEQLKEAGNILLNPSATEELLKFLGAGEATSLVSKNCTSGDRLLEQCGKINQQLRPPFTVLIQNAPNVENLQDQHNGHSTKEVLGNVQNSKFQGLFLKKDDPKIIALMQQAELLSSLALKVNSEHRPES